ncbi:MULTISPECIES: pyridoxamine 5'-phosphate oxidase family protein [unclassified Streptomyces]|uniref:pyridoxamine 5'-phosphate oxidase family protein n=1 Tax=unclassified Streptomyces TaxID=2593676 RepID=UPI002365DCC6|nr:MULTISPECIES: pyridoxamine 5'-phosphate oxidase family protein [unclassified Streptomyces]MDF3145188.1 pyridoxamine 5'-phosphate oxidase family protein [Streptomyces sp. T21Q-yed]WDF38948.1 pyridoxamine 5'-phosphate oxidase family protein [Streptomyces sp. T12]
MSTLWLLEGSSPGRPVYQQRELTVVRPARHVWEYGRLIVRAPVQAAAVPATVTYDVEEIRAVHGTGWTVTVHGPADVLSDDTLLCLHPQSVTGFRLTRVET